jgi:hypothetical protein
MSIFGKIARFFRKQEIVASPAFVADEKLAIRWAVEVQKVGPGYKIEYLSQAKKQYGEGFVEEIEKQRKGIFEEWEKVSPKLAAAGFEEEEKVALVKKINAISLSPVWFEWALEGKV